LVDDRGGAGRVRRGQLGGLRLRRGAGCRDDGFGLTTRGGAPLFGLLLQRLHVGRELLDVARDRVDVRAPLGDRGPDRLEKDQVEDDEEHQEVHELDDERPVEREQHGSASGRS
jgi:hypothetical protein